MRQWEKGHTRNERGEAGEEGKITSQAIKPLHIFRDIPTIMHTCISAIIHYTYPGELQHLISQVRLCKACVSFCFVLDFGLFCVFLKITQKDQGQEDDGKIQKMFPAENISVFQPFTSCLQESIWV